MMLFWRVFNENHGRKLQNLPPLLVVATGLSFRLPLMRYDPRHLDSLIVVTSWQPSLLSPLPSYSPRRWKSIDLSTAGNNPDWL